MKSCILIEPQILYLLPWHASFARAFEKLGYTVHTIVCDRNFFPELQKILDASCEFFLTLDGVAVEAEVNDVSLYDYLSIPIISLYTDHVEYYRNRILSSAKCSYSGLFDRYDISFAGKYLDSPTKYFFMPDAGLYNPDLKLLSFDERDIDIFFCGSIVDIEIERRTWKNFGGAVIEKFFMEMTDLLLADECLAPIDAYEAVLNSSGIYSDACALNGVFNVLSTSSHYVRGKRRIELLRTLAESGLKIQCFGERSDFDLIKSPNIIYNRYLTGEDFTDALRHSKITINTSPLSKYSMSDRQPSSMLNGALALTDTNPYIDLFFADDREIIAYTHDNYKAIPDRLREVLGNKQKWEQMTGSAREAALCHHTFDRRAEQILEIKAMFDALKPEGRK